jgi:hypothetical protein
MHGSDCAAGRRQRQPVAAGSSGRNLLASQTPSGRNLGE